jgi:hypothetical protein
MRVLPHLRHLIGEAAVEEELCAVRGLFGKGPPTGVPGDQTVSTQTSKGSSHSVASHTVAFTELHLRRQSGSRGQRSRREESPQIGLNLIVERDGAVSVDRRYL